MKKALLIFAKNPVYGKVKTRLALSIGDDMALAVYQQLLLHTTSVTNDLPVEKIVFYSYAIEQEDIWNNEVYKKHVQSGHDLGERMQNAFDYAFQEGNGEVVIIGTDCLELTSAIIMNAFAGLRNNDVVIGPASDGGYYLLAMKQMRSQLFHNINWSTDKVLKQTLAICKNENLLVYQLQELSDIDNENDLDESLKQMLQIKLNEIISVIIPTYNEEAQIKATIQKLWQYDENNLIKEIIVADGGSTDKTITIAQKEGVKIVISPKKGRAAQMNYGASFATGEILYFLHADTIPPRNFTRDIANAMAQGFCAGCFMLSFDYNHWFLKANCWFTRFDIDAIRFGDQSLFVTKDAFLKAGSFCEKHMVLEDQHLIKRLKKLVAFTIIKRPVITSSRKYLEKGIYKTQGIFFIIYFMYRLGYSQQKLVSTYKKLIVQTSLKKKSSCNEKEVRN